MIKCLQVRIGGVDVFTHAIISRVMRRASPSMSVHLLPTKITVVAMSSTRDVSLPEHIDIINFNTISIMLYSTRWI